MRRALVTGGNRGIGLAIATGLAQSGHDVVIGVRDVAAGQAVAAGIGARAVELDMERPEGFADALDELGGVDVLVNNAGVLYRTPALEDPTGFHRSLQIMLSGPYDLTRAAVPRMVAEGWGRIVNITSDYGSFAQGVQGPNGYGVAKAGLNALTRVLARELPASVKINAMHPGWVRTDMGGPSAPVSPEDGADTAIWLATLPDDGPTGGFFHRRKPYEW